MGLLSQVRENQIAVSASTLSAIAEDKERASILFRENVIKDGARLFDESYSRYRGLGNMLENEDTREQYKAAITLNMLSKVENFIENMKQAYGEATVSASLGALAPRVMDVVRIFYPNQVLLSLADVQPLDGAVGSIFIMKPRFSDSLPPGTLGPVTKGDEIFKTPTYYYAAENVGQLLGTGDASNKTFTGTAGEPPLKKGVNKIIAGSVTGVDNSAGAISGTGITTGTIDYTTGAVSVTFATAPATGVQVVLNYNSDFENDELAIRSIEFDMSVVPVQAKMHPVRFKYSVAAGLAASAHLAIDVQDTLAELAGSFVKQERDNLGISLIYNSAPVNANLNFNATPSTYYDRQSLYADIELKLNEGESIIQVANGRGGVSWVICGTNASNIFRNSKGFMPVPNPSAIGPHIIGYLRDGTVPVVKVISTVIPTNDYVVGYKGFMAGDAALILAEWIPIYFTPVWQAPTLTNQQGVMSMYDLFVNNANYFARGTVSGYVA
jgi:hypothetical protein